VNKDEQPIVNVSLASDPELQVEAGEIAFREGVLLESNPHAENTLAFDAWRSGWYNAEGFDLYEASL